MLPILQLLGKMVWLFVQYFIFIETFFFNLLKLLHRFHPDKINFTSLKKENKADNLELAFSVAESLGIPSLLDVEDMILVPKPEPFSVM